MVDRIELRKKVPHGYCSIIAKKAGVSQTSVSAYFSGNMNSEKIEKAALVIAAEIVKEKQRLIAAING